MTPAEFFRSHGACQEACEWLEEYQTIEAAWRDCADADWMEWALQCLDVQLTDGIKDELLRIRARRTHLIVSHSCSHMTIWYCGDRFCCLAARDLWTDKSREIADIIRQHIPVETVVAAYVAAGGTYA